MRSVFLFYKDMMSLDAVGSHEILSRMPGSTVKMHIMESFK